MIWSPQRRGMCRCRCSPMKVFAPEWKNTSWMNVHWNSALSCGWSPYIYAITWYYWFLWTYPPSQSIAHLTQSDGWNRSKKRENPKEVHCFWYNCVWLCCSLPLMVTKSYLATLFSFADVNRFCGLNISLNRQKCPRKRCTTNEKRPPLVGYTIVYPVHPVGQNVPTWYVNWKKTFKSVNLSNVDKNASCLS